ncbi:uncharacterized protein B0I36DRAFT_348750 [Microdochium trichocladiopsis]|uniref:Uncharacterized protein n=1 Tax=Microdochium trichocladiopsis TaxID=1682393 RepID=A0A9P8YA25_9PEZI|nr:uncharacterized protein B0I36DRAFT_348750 [Microdochium trichocladiopsis]KAH7033738.1 hypothetical protein B0I36DRAFT_348750 [Microdochium trichocladiopsis]
MKCAQHLAWNHSFAEISGTACDGAMGPKSALLAMQPSRWTFSWVIAESPLRPTIAINRIHTQRVEDHQRFKHLDTSAATGIALTAVIAIAASSLLYYSKISDVTDIP